MDALNGEPGVRSARFAGENASDAENRQLLLSRLDGIANRAARFRTVVALVNSKGEIHFETGICEGQIATHERGDAGFGYDSLFVPNEGDGRTFAEMNAEEKDSLSHRGRALRKVPDLLTRIFGLHPEQ